jgi:putative restriction endonuclease
MRITLTYGRLAQIIGGMPPALGRWMEPIQSYCIINRLPPLTVLVVSDVDGMPGAGFVAVSDVPEAQAHVFRHDWFAMKHVPTPAELAAAVARCPSNGVRTAGQDTEA